MPADNVPDWPRLADSIGKGLGRLTDDVLDNLRELLDNARQILNCTESGLLVPTDRENELKFLVSVNSKPEDSEIVKRIAVPCDSSIAGYVFNTGQLIAITKPSADQFFDEVGNAIGLETNEYLAVPVFDERQTLGVATFLNRPADGPQEPFSPQEIEWARGIAALAAVGLRYYRRISVQMEWARAELSQAVREFAPDVPAETGLPPSSGFVGDSQQPPVARALAFLETLSADHQELAADLLERLTDHLSS
ncbi:MAG: GAF domain-containing protein [Planctomycetes bacterium]|nr:GAF domain-containing protein [Planctomycetota bacterium]